MTLETSSPIQANPSCSAQIKSRGALPKIIGEITGAEHTLNVMSQGQKRDSGVHAAAGIRSECVWVAEVY